MMNTTTGPFGPQMTSGVAVNASTGFGNYNGGFASVKMADWSYVNKFTLQYGEEGQQALVELFTRASYAGIFANQKTSSLAKRKFTR